MKEFIKYTFATVTGLIITGVALTIIGFIFMIGVALSSKTTTSVQKNSVMQLELNGSLEERSEDNPLKDLKIINDKFSNYGLDDIISSIRKAKENPEIKGIYIKATALSTSFASLQEIRNALIDFKKSGKFIISYADSYTQGLYYLCSVSDKIILNPQGSIEWKGLCAQTMFYKNLLDKLGVKMQIFRVGTYKSAVEPFFLDKMSPASRLQMSNIVNSIWGQVLTDVSSSRKISATDLNKYADSGIMFEDAQQAKHNHMIDGLAYQEDMPNIIKSVMKKETSTKIPLLSLDDMIDVKFQKSCEGDEIAVYYAFGEIDGNTSGTDDDSGINSEKVVTDLKELAEDNSIKAVVLRVNSPGGSAFGSEQIWHAVMNLKKKKPVVVSMGDYAASGGYYISSAANAIVAQPTTLTGSIGIFGLIPEAGELTKKIGISFDEVKTNKFSDFGTISRGMNPEEQAMMQMEINRGYKLFLSRCATGRKCAVSKIEPIAQGRVWTGAEAAKIGLVDKLGNLNDAIKLASQIAKVKTYYTKGYPKKEDLLSSLFITKTTQYIKSQILKSDMGEYFKTLGLINRVQNHIDAIQTRMPYNLNIR